MTTKLEGAFNRSVLIIGFAESVSNLGSWITMMAVFALVVFRGDGGVLQSSGIMMAGLLPLLVASPVAGWLCDHFDRRRMMIASELTSALVISSLVFTSSLVLIYAALALQAFTGSVMTPARRSLLPSLVARGELARANAFFQQLSGSMKIAAPLAAGGLLAIMSPHTAILLDVASYVLSALLLSRLPSGIGNLSVEAAHARLRVGAASSPTEDAGSPPTPRPEPLRREAPGVARDGALRALVLTSAPLRLIFIAAFAAILVIVGFDILASVYVRDSLHSGEGLFGTLVSLIGAGTVGISLYVMLGKKRREPWSDLVRGLLLLSVIPLSFAIAGFLPSHILRATVAAVGCLIGGAGNGLLNVQAGTLLQTLSPMKMLGRLSGAFQGTAVAGQLTGIVLTPALVPSIVPMGGYFVISFSALAVLALWVVLSLRSVRLSGAAASSE